MKLSIKHDENAVNQNALEELESQSVIVKQLIEKSLAFPVNNQEDAKNCINLIADARNIFKSIENLRKETIKPIKSILNNWNDSFAVLTDALEEVQANLKGKLNTWQSKETAKIEAQKVDNELMAEAFESEIVPLVKNDSKNLCAKGATTYEKSEWSFIVEDLSIVPREFLTIDKDKVNLSIKAGIRNIPGLKIQETKKQIIRSR